MTHRSPTWRAGFTLVEVAVGLLLVGVVAYLVLAMSSALEAGGVTEPNQEVVQAASTLIESGYPFPNCPSTTSIALAGREYRVCQEPAGVSLNPPANMTLFAFTYRFEAVNASAPASFFLTWVDWEGAPPPPPPSPNFSASCQKISGNQLRMTVTNSGVTVTTNKLSLIWNGQGNRRIKEVASQGSTLWSGSAKKDSQITLNSNLSFGSRTLDFTFDKAFKKGNYTFTLQLFVGQGNNQVTYGVSCTVRW